MTANKKCMVAVAFIVIRLITFPYEPAGSRSGPTEDPYGSEERPLVPSGTT